VLDDDERRALGELEGRTAAEDPAFVRGFTALDAAPRIHRPGSDLEASALVALVVALLLGVPLLLAGSVTGALAVAATTWLLRAAWRRSSTPPVR
jgi:DUF3040 family protein